MTRDVYNQSGLSGATYVGTSETFVGDGAGIYVLLNTTLDSAVAPGGVNVSALTGVSILAPSFIPGRFTSVAVNTGLIAIPNLTSGNTVA